MDLGVPSAYPRPVGGMEFEILGEIDAIETIAIGQGIRDVTRLHKSHGGFFWRKLKGRASIRLETGRVRRAELHWYEAHGVGRVRMKIKRFLD